MPNHAAPIRVLVAEDNRDLCDAVCALVAAEPDMQVVASVRRASDLLQAASTNDVSVLVLDLDLNGESSLPALQAMRRARLPLAVVIYSGHDQRDFGAAFADAGPCEYVAKTGDALELLGAIRRAAATTAGAGN